jgi:hypothetical protein
VDLFLPVRFYWVRRYRWLKEHGLTEEQAAKRVTAVSPIALPGTASAVETPVGTPA